VTGHCSQDADGLHTIETGGSERGMEGVPEKGTVRGDISSDVEYADGTNGGRRDGEEHGDLFA